MEIADTIAGYLLLGGTFLFFTSINYGILFMRVKKVERIPSPAPLIGGIAGAMLMICIIGFNHPIYIMLPLFIDPGSIPLIIWFIICLVSDLRRKS